MTRLTLLITATLAAMPLIAASQTINAPGGQASTALPPDISAPNASTPTPRMRKPRKSMGKSNATDRNSAPGIDADTAVRNGPNVANTGRTQPQGSTSDTPSKRAE